VTTYILIVGPLARALWALEATTASPSDGFVFWLAIANVLESIFDQGENATGISATLAERVRGIFNNRYHAFFNHSEVYFVGFCLDPRYKNDQFLCERFIEPSEAVERHIKFPHAFIRVKNFLKTLLQNLIAQHKKHKSAGAECLCHPIVQTQSTNQLSMSLKLQVHAFWLGEAPFHTPVVNDDAMEWWENLAAGSSPRSDVLSMLAIRISGILINSMPDERTNSNITWFNSPLRGNQKGETVMNMVEIGHWYKYHAAGPRKSPRRPTVPFRRLDKKLVNKIKMRKKEGTDDDSSISSDSEEGDVDSED
ncbi:hypothetical protein GGX14DRAFT_301730, partial [Mycena pura]